MIPDGSLQILMKNVDGLHIVPRQLQSVVRFSVPDTLALADDSCLQFWKVVFIDAARIGLVLNAQVRRGSCCQSVASSIGHELGVGSPNVRGADMFPSHH